MLGQCRAMLLNAGIRAVVTFADPSVGHVGIIYQAFNSIYLGTTAARTTLWLPDGTCLDERTLQISCGVGGRTADRSRVGAPTGQAHGRPCHSTACRPGIPPLGEPVRQCRAYPSVVADADLPL